MFGGDASLGLYKSQDHGQTWEPVNEGINAVVVNDIVIDPRDRTHILAATVAGLFEKKAATGWSRILSGSPVYSLAFHPADSTIFYAGINNYLARTAVIAQVEYNLLEFIVKRKVLCISASDSRRRLPI